MPCVNIGGAIVCSPSIEDVWIKWLRCHDRTCSGRFLGHSPFISVLYGWYGYESCCMRCGREYNEDGMKPLYGGHEQASERLKSIEHYKIKYRAFLSGKKEDES